MPLVYLAASWAAGIAIAKSFSPSLALWAWWLVFPLASLLWARRNPQLRLILFCITALLLGALRYTLALPQFDANALAAFNDRGALAMLGDVVDDPDPRDRNTNLRVSITRVRANNQWREASGLALVQVPRETDVRYGDRLDIYGEPTTPPEFADFSYKEYLARQGIHSFIRLARVTVVARDQGNPFFTALYAFRHRALATLHALFPEPAAALLAGILLGMDSGIPRDLRDAFAATNTAHIVAISGFNIAVLAGILAQLARRVWRPGPAALAVIGGLAVYTLLVGASASVVRAAIMGSLTVFAAYVKRPGFALNALAVAALAMTAWNPFTLFDLGFQLSFLATVGLVLYTEPIEKFFQNAIASRNAAKQHLHRTQVQVSPSNLGIASSHPSPSPRSGSGALLAMTRDSLIPTLAAQITTTPLIVFAFHRLSIIGIVTNLLVLPVQPAVMIVGGLATLTGMLVQPIGQVIAWVAWTFTQWTIVVVQFTASLPLASIPVGYFDVALLGAYYFVLFGAPRVEWKAMSNRVMRNPSLALGALFVFAFLLVAFLFTVPDGKTRIEFLDAGGASTFIRAPNGTRALIDGGANPSATLSALGARLPFWDRRLDLVVLTNTGEDHLAGLVAVLERYEVRQIIEPSPPARPSAAYLKWRELIAQKRVPVLPAQSGLQVENGAWRLEIVSPREGEKGSVVARLRAGGIAILFADSAETKEQDALVKAGESLASAVLIAPRKIAPAFFDAVNPTTAILFVDASARDKPSAEMLSALASALVLRTDERGVIELVVEGERVEVRTAR